MKKTLIIKFIVQSLVTLFLIYIIVMFAFWSYNQARDELVKTYSDYTLAVAKNNANDIELKFHDLRLLFDYIIEELQQEGINEKAFSNPYFQKVYSAIAEDFLVFDENGNILYRGNELFLVPEQLKDIFLKTIKEERGLPTPRLSEYNVINIKKKKLGIFLFFNQFLYGENQKKIYLTFVISGQRIIDNYIKNLQLANEGYAYIVDDDYIVLASGNKKHLGKNLYQIVGEELQEILKINENKSTEEIQKAKAAFDRHSNEKEDIFDSMVEGEYGTKRYADRTGKYTELLSFYPISIPGDTWSFAVKTPYTFVIKTFKGSFNRTLFLTILFVLILCFNFFYVAYHYKKRLVAEFEVDQISGLLEKEQSLRRAEYRYKQLYQGTKDIILICDSDFNIEAINSAGVKAIGLNIKNITHKMKCSDRFINKEDLDEFLSILNSSKSVDNFQTTVEVNGKKQYLEISADKHFDEKEKREDIYFVIRDTTEHKQLQEEIIQKERLESVMALVVTANHEINNPLAGINLNLDLIKTLVPDDDPRLQSHLKDISKNVFRIADVLKKLNDIEEIKEKDYTKTVKMLNIDKEE